MGNTVYIGKTPRMPLLHCPNCGQLVDGATSVSSAPGRLFPTPGSCTVCIYCCAALVFEESIATACPVKLRAMTPSEREQALQRPLFRMTEKAVREMMQQRTTGGRG